MQLPGRFRAGLLPFIVLACLATLMSWSPNRGQAEVDLRERAFVQSDLTVSSHSVALAAVISRLPNGEAWERFIAAQSRRVAVFIDPRSGTPANLISSVSMIPGDGVGNTITLPNLATRIGLSLTEVTPEAVGLAVREYVLDHLDVFAIDRRQLGTAHGVRVEEHHWEVSIPQ